ncbi:hypothetical protein KFK09_027281 [Dendrobium nobile]|uniref:Uncharacterized protein n=1 Tax=Dendrobium nobile TaxID=94219 RepID=A0A8T3AFH4_DENNO|nr:hypothetical protein KFK09_027281 [Dendrobium nobile]
MEQCQQFLTPVDAPGSQKSSISCRGFGSELDFSDSSALESFSPRLYLFVVLLRRCVRYCSVLRSSRRQRIPLNRLYRSAWPGLGCRMTALRKNGAGEV